MRYSVNMYKNIIHNLLIHFIFKKNIMVLNKINEIFWNNKWKKLSNKAFNDISTWATWTVLVILLAFGSWCAWNSNNTWEWGDWDGTECNEENPVASSVSVDAWGKTYVQLSFVECVSDCHDSDPTLKVTIASAPKWWKLFEWWKINENWGIEWWKELWVGSTFVAGANIFYVVNTKNSKNWTLNSDGFNFVTTDSHENKSEPASIGINNLWENNVAPEWTQDVYDTGITINDNPNNQDSIEILNLNSFILNSNWSNIPFKIKQITPPNTWDNLIWDHFIDIENWTLKVSDSIYGNENGPDYEWQVSVEVEIENSDNVIEILFNFENSY
jgi:hypothetical protein